MNATIINIGDELLIGQTINTNAAWMGQALNSIGIKAYESLAISDEAQHIKKTLANALANSTVVLITGGLGPTKDDITKKTLAEYFETDLVFNAEILADITNYLTSRGRPVLDSAKSLALVPANCQVIRNEKGTAAAMWFEEEGKVIVSMPGVPYEMKGIMTSSVLPKLTIKFNTPNILHKTILCAGTGETIIAHKIQHIENNLPPHIKLAYLPTRGVVKLRFSATGQELMTLQKEVDSLVLKTVNILYPKYAFGYDKQQLAGVIGTLLLDKEATLGIAESCTGGKIGAAITKVAGSSRYFKGGIIAYANELKQNLLGVKAITLKKHGAVSEATVIEMAKGTRAILQTDYALAISGIAGPTGGTVEKPVGTVWVAVACENKVVTKKYTFARDRTINIDLATTYALNQLRRLILGII